MTTPQQLLSFALSQCSVSVSSYTVSGFAKGDALTVEFPNDDFEIETGSDGYHTLIEKYGGDLADGMMRLQQGNPLIAAFRTLHEASRTAGGVAYQFRAVNKKSPDEKVVGKLVFKKRTPIKWADTAQPAEIPFFLIVESIQGGTLLSA